MRAYLAIPVILIPLLTWSSASGTEPGQADGERFFRELIEPLLSKHCFECHSDASDTVHGGLLLDRPERLFKGGESGAVVVPGSPEKSRLLTALRWSDDSLQMPPDAPLNAEEIALFEKWIGLGTPYPEPATELAQVPFTVSTAAREHWAFQPLHQPVIPENEHPVDFFIDAALRERNLARNPPADEAISVRRLYLDLIGLPPTPQELAKYLANPHPQRYEQLVDTLLASPRYGERWGRHWLDIVRFSESEGFEYDRLRPNGWQYRDYVIRSFNEDKPYDQFMFEQIAGDAAEHVTRDSIIAAGMLVCGAYDSAGNSQANATQRAITREEELEDLISVVGQTFLGLTINCARCHHHKFDPISQSEYYQVKSVFEGVQHGERSLETPVEAEARRTWGERLRAERAGLARTLRSLELRARGRLAPTRLSQTDGELPTPCWTVDLTRSPPDADALHGAARVEDASLQLPEAGSFYQSLPLAHDLGEKSLEAWLSLDRLDQSGGAAISIERTDGTVFDAIVFGEREPRKWSVGSEFFRRTRDLKAAEEDAAPSVLLHLVATFRQDGQIALFRNGEPYGEPYQAESELPPFRAGEARVLLGKRHTGGGNPWLVGSVSTAAIYDRALRAEEVRALYSRFGHRPQPVDIVAAMTAEERQEYDRAQANDQILARALASLETPAPVAYVGKRVVPGPTHRLLRGDVLSPGETVVPGGLASIGAPGFAFHLPSDAPEAERRRAFAEWLRNPQNPLPARVVANRLWHYHFGQGIVSTPSDFGLQGSPPTHPKLLDWLAGQLIEHNWSIKALQRIIVNSQTFRQSSDFRSAAAEVDADNNYLWRYTPRRMDAEVVRDAMLAVAGQLNLEMGGPGFRPFTTTEFGATFYHLVDSDEPAYCRRSIYRTHVNSAKDPLMDVFDCPDPSVKTPRRGMTTTPLQALVLMNGSFTQRQAEHLVAQSLQDAKGDQQHAIVVAFQRVLLRDPSLAERARVESLPEQRQLHSVCWALLNSTEFLYVR